MPDPRFFDRQEPLSIAQINDITALENFSDLDGDQKFIDVAPLDDASNQDISFLDNVKYKDDFLQTNAGACFVSANMADLAPEHTVPFVTKTPYKAYALIAQKFYPQQRPTESVSDSAYIHETAKIGKGCVIEHGVVIHGGAKIGDHCWIESNTVIGKNVEIGNHCHIGANASISHSLIGDYVRVYPGCRIGQDGFGFAIDPNGHVKVPQLGRVIIEDHVEIGANTTIDRGAGPDTVIGQGTWIDNLVQIGHNVKIGKGCVIVAQVGISGSAELDDFVMIGGQAGVAGHLKVGKGVQVSAQSGVMRDVPAGEKMIGAPAVPAKQFMRQVATLQKLSSKKEK